MSVLTSRTGVLPAVEIDPERVIHVISHILFRRYNSDSPPSPSEEGPNVGVVANPEAEGSVSEPLFEAIMIILASKLGMAFQGDAVAVDGPQPSICFLSTSFMDVSVASLNAPKRCPHASFLERRNLRR